MTNEFAFLVKELVEERVRKRIKEGYTTNQILQEAHCLPSLIDKIRKEEKILKEFKEWEKCKIGEITEPERWLE